MLVHQIFEHCAGVVVIDCLHCAKFQNKIVYEVEIIGIIVHLMITMDTCFELSQVNEGWKYSD